MKNERVMGKTVKIGPTLSQILLSVVDKIAYLDVMDLREACMPFYKTSPTPPSFVHNFARL